MTTKVKYQTADQNRNMLFTQQRSAQVIALSKGRKQLNEQKILLGRPVTPAIKQSKKTIEQQ